MRITFTRESLTWGGLNLVKSLCCLDMSTKTDNSITTRTEDSDYCAGYANISILHRVLSTYSSDEKHEDTYHEEDDICQAHRLSLSNRRV